MSSKARKKHRVLFVCTGNSCRSQMAEALLRHLGGDRFQVSSAGTNPAGYIHPLAIEAMKRLNVPLEAQHSKSWKEIANAPQDIVITVCDHAACAPPPPLRGQPAIGHWSLPDPSFVPGTPEERTAAALAVAAHLQQWLTELIALPLDQLSREDIERELARIAST